jgi:hypothetical protein
VTVETHTHLRLPAHQDFVALCCGDAIERIYTDPGNQVKVSCAPSMQCWTRRDPPRPPGAPSGLSMARQAVQHVEHHRVSPVGARRLQDSRGCWQQWVSPGGSDQLRQQRARPDIALVDPGQEPSLTLTYIMATMVARRLFQAGTGRHLQDMWHLYCLVHAGCWCAGVLATTVAFLRGSP